MSPDRKALSLLRRRVYCRRVIQMQSVLVIFNGVLPGVGERRQGRAEVGSRH
jgi:hypothetical protein